MKNRDKLTKQRKDRADYGSYNSKQSDRLSEIYMAIDSFCKPTEYYVTKDGELYA